MGFWRLVSWDLVMLWRSGAAAATIGVLIAACALASFTGLGVQNAHRAAIAEAISLAQAAAPATTASQALQGPHTIRMRMMTQEPPLLDFATGRAGLDPLVGEATPLTPLHRVFENYQIGNPQGLALVRFDFVFLATVMAPLILIALCAGLWAEDRRTGRFALLVAHGARPSRILLARIVARALLVAVPLGAGLCVQAMLGGGVDGARGFAFAVFIGVAGLGLLFWAGLCVALNSIVHRGASSAAALFVAWLILTAAGPSAIAAGAQAFAPAPARLAFLADARTAEINAVKNAEDLAQAFLNDHPELEQGGFDVPAWAKSRYVVSLEIDAAVAPTRAAFEQSLQRQSDFVSSLQALSPTLSASIAMTDAAGTGVFAALSQQANARAQVSGLRDAMGASIMGGRGVEEKQAQSWTMRTLQAHPSPAWASLGWLSLWVIGVWCFAFAALRSKKRPDALAARLQV
jgi:ABC-2 type transport system permease protein